MSSAVLISLKDPVLQRYVQKHPFGTGPDEALNRRCAIELGSAIQFRSITEVPPSVLPGQVSLPPGWQDRSGHLFEILGRRAAEIENIWADYDWKVSAIPADSQRILSIGCGDGSELAVIRAAFPTAELHAIDWECQLSPTAQEELGVTYEIANFVDTVATESRQYDAIFSNHVIEHLFNPDETLRQLRQWLAPGGVLVSALPLDADPDRPFVGEMLQLISKRESVSLLELDRIDLGHPWKTNLADLLHTLGAAGYVDVKMFERPDHLSRLCPGDRDEIQQRRKTGEILCRAVFGPLRALLRLVPGAPFWTRKLQFALESRVWFGHHRLKNLLAPEVLLVAYRPLAA